MSASLVPIERLFIQNHANVRYLTHELTISADTLQYCTYRLRKVYCERYMGCTDESDLGCDPTFRVCCNSPIDSDPGSNEEFNPVGQRYRSGDVVQVIRQLKGVAAWKSTFTQREHPVRKPRSSLAHTESNTSVATISSSDSLARSLVRSLNARGSVHVRYCRHAVAPIDLWDWQIKN